MLHVRDFHVPPGKIFSEHQNQNQLHGLGGLQGKKPELNPGPRPLQLARKKQKSQQNQKPQNIEREQKPAVSQNAPVQRTEKEKKQKSQPNPDNLPRKEIVAKSRSDRSVRGAQGLHRNQPRQKKRNHNHQKHPVYIRPP